MDILALALQPALSLEGTAAIGAILGAILGSFLGTVAVRLPQGRSIVSAPSACDACGQRLGPAALVPIASWMIQRGRCRGCGVAIGAAQLAAEAGGALVGALAWCAGEGRVVAAMILGWQLLLLALLDARSLWLPWRLTALLAASGLGVALWQGQADAGPWLAQAMPAGAILGGAMGYGLLALVACAYRRMRGRAGLGGGDPLLLGAIGIWVGPVGVIHAMLGAALIGLAVAAAMAWRGRDVGAQTMLPLGTFMAIAAWPVYLLG